MAEEDLADVLKEVILTNIKAGDYIFKTEDPPEYMYLIYKMDLL